MVIFIIEMPNFSKNLVNYLRNLYHGIFSTKEMEANILIKTSISAPVQDS